MQGNAGEATCMFHILKVYRHEFLLHAHTLHILFSRPFSNQRSSRSASLMISSRTYLFILGQAWDALSILLCSFFLSRAQISLNFFLTRIRWSARGLGIFYAIVFADLIFDTFLSVCFWIFRYSCCTCVKVALAKLWQQELDLTLDDSVLQLELVI